VWPALAVAIAGLAAWGWLGRPSTPDRPVLRAGLLEADLASSASSGSGALAISPDGSQVAFIHSGDDDLPAISLRRLDSFEPRQIVSANTITSLAFSPDGESLVYHDGASIRAVSLAPGGLATRELAPSADRNNARSVGWGADGYVYYQDTDFNLARVPASGGSPELLWEVDDDGVVLGPPVVLSGRQAGLVEISGGRYGGTPSVGVFDFVTRGLDTLSVGSGVRLVDEYLMWHDAGTLYGQRFDADTRSGVGPVVALVDGIPTNNFVPMFDVSANGTLVHQLTAPTEDNLVAISRAGVRVDRGQSVPSLLGMRLSPQGNRVVFEEASGDRSDIWTLDLASGTRARITFDQIAFYPTWSSDGAKVAYYKVVDGDYDLYWKNADGTGVEDVLLSTPSREIEVAFVPGDEQIVVRQGDRARADGSDIYLYDTGDPDSGRPIADGPGNAVSPMVSPDGRYITYSSDESHVPQVFVRSLENPAELYQVSVETGTEPFWHPDGTELLFRTSTRLFAAPISLEGGFALEGRPIDLFATGDLQANANHTTYTIMPDGETFLFIKNPRIAETRIVVNWIQEVRAIMAPQ
jgi:Tol biopolymer transport system component